MDFLYPAEDFSSPAFRAALSKKEGDGGLSPGRLVFAGDFERFTGKNYDEALAEISGGKAPGSSNLGGPSVVSLAHAAQILRDGRRVCFYGNRGNDETGKLVEEALARLPFAEY